MPVHIGPAQDPGAFITFAPWAIAAGTPPDDRYALEVTASVRGSVRLRSCGPRGGWLYMAGAGYLDLTAGAAMDLAAALTTLAQGPIGGTLRAAYDPAVLTVDHYASGDGGLTGELDPAGRVVLVITPAGHRRGRLAPVALDRAAAATFAGCIAAAAAAAAGARAHTDPLA